MTTRLTRYLVRRASLNELTQMFERQTGVPVALSVGGVVAAKCVRAAEQFDLVMLASDAIEKLTAAERVVAESRSTWRVRVSRCCAPERCRTDRSGSRGWSRRVMA